MLISLIYCRIIQIWTLHSLSITAYPYLLPILRFKECVHKMRIAADRSKYLMIHEMTSYLWLMSFSFSGRKMLSFWLIKWCYPSFIVHFHRWLLANTWIYVTTFHFLIRNFCAALLRKTLSTHQPYYRFYMSMVTLTGNNIWVPYF